MIQPSFSSSPGGAAVFDTTLIERSAWFDGAADYMARQNGSAFTNTKEAIFSFWIRRGKFSTQQAFFGSVESSQGFILQFTSADKLEVYAAGATKKVSTQVFRDTAYYHIIVSFDTSQATATDRIKVWVNGEQITSWTTDTAMTLNGDIGGLVGVQTGAETMHIGNYNNTVSNFYFWNGYVAQACMLESVSIQQGDYAVSDFLDTYTFGDNGSQYVPKADADIAALATAAGGNSFCLTTAIGDGTDASGNGNNFTPTSMSDAANGSPNTPSLVYPVLSFIDNDGNAVGGGNFFEGNKGWQGTSAGYSGPISTQWLNPASETGGFYIEAKLYNATNINVNLVGLLNESFDRNPNQYLGSTAGSWGVDGYARFYAESVLIFDSTNLTTASVVQFYFEPSEGKLWIGIDDSYWNGSSLTTFSAASPSVSGLPTDQLYAFGIRGGNSGGWYMYFEEQDWTYSPPASGVPINSANLGTRDYQGIDYFNPILYTGNGSTNAITGVGFQPDLVWIKNRTGVTSHGIYDAVRGVQEQIESDNTSAETTETTGLTAFGSDGFTVGSLAQVNTNTNNFVGWNWLAGGAGASNTDGSITSTVSKAAADHFSIVTYTGTGAAATVGHGLGGVPDLIIVKNRGTTGNWAVQSSETSYATNVLYLNLTNASAAAALSVWNSTNPTSSVFSINSSADTNASTNTYVSYCFKNVPGVCKIGLYKGNGSADGPFSYTGFRPSWVMVKRIDSTADWHIIDVKRDPYNVMDSFLFADLSNGESSDAAYNRDLLSDGFKIRASLPYVNASGGSFLFIAMADIAGGGDLPPIYGR